jgi:diazepam-binding inhibitor (GABA receptor modulating acyl-CoA-binding protein)
MDFKGKAKWDQWNSLKGMQKEAAQAKYVEHVEALKKQHN